MTTPRRPEWAFYATALGLAATSLIDWPVAVLLIAGHFVAKHSSNAALQELGEAAEAVG